MCLFKHYIICFHTLAVMQLSCKYHLKQGQVVGSILVQGLENN